MVLHSAEGKVDCTETFDGGGNKLVRVTADGNVWRYQLAPDGRSNTVYLNDIPRAWQEINEAGIVSAVTNLDKTGAPLRAGVDYVLDEITGVFRPRSAAAAGPK